MSQTTGSGTGSGISVRDFPSIFSFVSRLSQRPCRWRTLCKFNSETEGHVEHQAAVEDEQGWYVNYQGKRRFLGKHPEDAPRPVKSDEPDCRRGMQGVQPNAFSQVVDGPEPGSALRSALTPAPVAGDCSVATITWSRESRPRSCHGRANNFARTYVGTRSR